MQSELSTEQILNYDIQDPYGHKTFPSPTSFIFTYNIMLQHIVCMAISNTMFKKNRKNQFTATHPGSLMSGRVRRIDIMRLTYSLWPYFFQPSSITAFASSDSSSVFSTIALPLWPNNKPH